MNPVSLYAERKREKFAHIVQDVCRLGQAGEEGSQLDVFVFLNDQCKVRDIIIWKCGGRRTVSNSSLNVLLSDAGSDATRAARDRRTSWSFFAVPKNTDRVSIGRVWTENDGTGTCYCISHVLDQQQDTFMQHLHRRSLRAQMGFHLQYVSFGIHVCEEW